MISLQALAGGVVDGFNKGFDSYQASKEQRIRQLHDELSLALKARDRNKVAAISQQLNGPDFSGLFDDMEREQAAKRYASLQDLAKGSGDYAGAAAFIPEIIEARNAITGREDVGPKLIGTYGIAEGERPSPDFQGPMPAATTYDPEKPDFNHPANQKAISSLTQFAPPAPPKPTYDHLRYVPGVGLVNLASGQVAIESKEKPAPEKAPAKGWVRQPDGSDLYQELIPGVTKSAPPAKPAKAGGVSVTGTQRWSKEIDNAARRFNVPAGLIRSIMAAESGGNPEAMSPAGAIGLMQFMPGTARDMGIDPRDPRQAIEGGAKYLRQLFDRYGDWTKAVAAYNAGPGNVDKYGGVPPFPETQAYVKKVFAATKAPATEPKKTRGVRVDVENGRRITKDAATGEVLRDEPAAEPKPFDRDKAAAAIKREMGIRRKVPPSKQADFDKRMAERERAHNARGGKSEKDAFFDFLEKEI